MHNGAQTEAVRFSHGPLRVVPLLDPVRTITY
jgi:hypothetical protein